MVETLGTKKNNLRSQEDLLEEGVGTVLDRPEVGQQTQPQRLQRLRRRQCLQNLQNSRNARLQVTQKRKSHSTE